MTKKLEILKASLRKKEERFDSKLDNHFASAREANGQPLNDKRNGGATLSKWENQNNALRAVQDGIEVTKRAIEREESSIATVNAVALPDVIKQKLEAGELVQWRKHPNCFFVPGVDRGRIVWNEEKKEVAHRYLREVPADQYSKFRDAYNGLRQALSA